MSATCSIENPVDRQRSATLARVRVDTGSALTWASARVPERIGIAREKRDVPFVHANGVRVTRGVVLAIVRMRRRFTIEELVFAEPGDRTLLGARPLDGPCAADGATMAEAMTR